MPITAMIAPIRRWRPDAAPDQRRPCLGGRARRRDAGRSRVSRPCRSLRAPLMVGGDVRGGHLAPEPRPHGCVLRCRCPTADHARREPQRRARECAAVRGDSAAGGRARDRQPRRPGVERSARPRRPDRPRGRADARDVRGGHRLRRAARCGSRRDPVPVLLRGRPLPGPAGPHLRHRPHVADRARADAAPPAPPRGVGGPRRPRGRDPGDDLPGRADPPGRGSDRRHQRPEHHAGGPLRR